MKTFFFLFVFIFGIQSTKSQTFEYIGPVNKEIISEMEGIEILLFLDCLEHIGETTNSISWLPYEQSIKYIKDIRKYRSFIFSIDTENTIPKTREYKGKKKLSVNKYFLHIRRTDNFSKVEIYQLI